MPAANIDQNRPPEDEPAQFPAATQTDLPRVVPVRVFQRMASRIPDARQAIADRLARAAAIVQPGTTEPLEAANEGPEHQEGVAAPAIRTELPMPIQWDRSVLDAVTQGLNGWGGSLGSLGFRAVKPLAERTSMLLVERAGGLLKNAMNDPAIQGAAVTVVKEIVSEAGYWVGGRTGGRIVESAAERLALRIVQALATRQAIPGLEEAPAEDHPPVGDRDG